MPKMTLTKAERKAGMDLRDFLPRSKPKKPRTSAQAKRDRGAAEMVRFVLMHTGTALSDKRESKIVGDGEFLIESVEASEKGGVECEVLVRFFLKKEMVDIGMSRVKK